MEELKPQRLNKGDTIGFLSVSGEIKDVSKLEKAKKEFESLGYHVKISPNTYTPKDYLCGTDAQRAQALNDFFKDPEINAIVAARGGYGAIRILDKIDYDLIKNNPKIFVGYSDITALQLMIYKKTGLVTYNGAMAYSDFACGITSYTKDSFFNVLTCGIDEIIIDEPKVYYAGTASGVLWGGNLSTVQSMCGQDFIPDEKFIFIAEDINESVYKIDKMFTQLLNIKQFKHNLAGIVLGDFSGIDNDVYFHNFFTELAAELKIPVIGGLKFGHEADKQTFPIGVNVVLSTDLGRLNLSVAQE